ncbi:hypothetical protein CP8484711_2052B, partial [Chlamydia psittaci 84-8471/1]
LQRPPSLQILDDQESENATDEIAEDPLKRHHTQQDEDRRIAKLNHALQTRQNDLYQSITDLLGCVLKHNCTGKRQVPHNLKVIP